MRVQGAVVKSGDETKLGAFGEFAIDNFLSIIEAAAALNLAAEALVRALRGAGAPSRGVAYFVLGDSIADTNDHGERYNR
jgi:hypothetical protein